MINCIILDYSEMNETWEKYIITKQLPKENREVVIDDGIFTNILCDVAREAVWQIVILF